MLHFFTLNGECHTTRKISTAQSRRGNNASTMQNPTQASKDAPGKTPKGPDAVKASGSKGAPSTTTSYAKAIGKQKPETVSAPPSVATSPAVMLGLTDLDDRVNTPLSDQLSLLSFLDDGLNTAFSARLDRASARIDLLAD